MALILNAFFEVAHAHEDPRGDVHPHVQIDAGNFVVYFQSNIEPQIERHGEPGGQKTRWEPAYKTVISPEGKVLEQRIPLQREPYFFPEWMKRLMHADPFGGGSGGEKEPLLPAEWPDGKSPDDLEGITIQGNRLFFYFTGGKDNSFRIGTYDLGKKKLLQTAVIGKPGRIYSFACASEVLPGDKEAWIAWIEERNVKVTKEKLANGSTGEFYNSDTQVVVSRWNLETNKVTHLPIRQTMDDNVYLSLNRIGDHLLVAWHERAFPHARVWTEHINLKSAKFSAELPFSPLPSHGLQSFPSP